MRITVLVALSFVSMFTGCSNATSTNGNDRLDIRNVWWSLVSFEPVTGGTITLASNERYLVFFTDTLSRTDSTLSIWKGYCLWGKTDSLCGNTYYSTYLIGQNDSLSIDPIGTTKIGCRKSYSDYLRALEKATSFQIRDNNLTVFHSGGTKKLEFAKQ